MTAPLSNEHKINDVIINQSYHVTITSSTFQWGLRNSSRFRLSIREFRVYTGGSSEVCKNLYSIIWRYIHNGFRIFSWDCGTPGFLETPLENTQVSLDFPLLQIFISLRAVGFLNRNSPNLIFQNLITNYPQLGNSRSGGWGDHPTGVWIASKMSSFLRFSKTSVMFTNLYWVSDGIKIPSPNQIPREDSSFSFWCFCNTTGIFTKNI